MQLGNTRVQCCHGLAAMAQAVFYVVFQLG
jgi:hypothetical protein